MSEIFLIIVLIGLAFSDRDRAMFYYHKIAGSSSDVKKHLIGQIVKQMRAGGITQEELAQALSNASVQETTASSGNVMTRLFGTLGGIFVLSGVGTYIGMFWEQMSSPARIIITLGLGFALSIFGIVAVRENKYPRIIVPVFIAAAAACTLGGFVFLYEMFPHSNDPAKAMLIVFAFMALHQLVMYQFLPSILSVAMGIFFLYSALGSAFEVAGISWRWSVLILGGSLLVVSQGLAKSRFSALVPICILVSAIWINVGIFDWSSDLTTENWALIITGISIFALGFGLSIEAQSNLSGLFYLVGLSMALSGLFDLVDRTSYDLLFLLISMGLVYVSIILKSRAVLLVGTLSILFFIGYYADLYFINSLGLPIALIMAGFVFIGISAGALKIKKKYF